MNKVKKSIVIISFIILSLIVICIKLNIDYQNNDKNIVNSLEKFNEKNYSFEECKKINIQNIEKIDKKNCIVISKMDKFTTCSILHKNILRGWKVVSSTVPGAINKNTIIYTSAPEYGLGFLIGSVEYSDKIQYVKINQKKAVVIKIGNELVFYSNINIENLNENGKEYKPEISIFYKDGSILTKKGWYW